MRKQLPVLDTPLNADERLLHAIAIRLDRVIELLECKNEEPQVVITSEEEVIEYDVETMTKKEIMLVLDEKNVEYNTRANKAELIELIK